MKAKRSVQCSIDRSEFCFEKNDELKLFCSWFYSRSTSYYLISGTQLVWFYRFNLYNIWN